MRHRLATGFLAIVDGMETIRNNQCLGSDIWDWNAEENPADDFKLLLYRLATLPEKLGISLDFYVSSL